MHSLLFRLGAICAFAVLGACVKHVPRIVTIDTMAAAFEEAPVGPLPFDEAVERLVTNNPELRATRARIQAVNVDPGPGALSASQEIMDGRATELMVRTDLLALLGLGSRPAEAAWARAVRNERVREHHQRARRLVADLAAAYAVDQALRDLPTPEVELNLAAFESAGLASGAVLSAGRALAEEGRAEVRVTAAQLADARRAIAKLVGVSPDARFDPSGWPEAQPDITAPKQRQLVLARGELQTAMARWDAADRRFRFEVERQYPTLMVGLGHNFGPDLPMQMVGVQLPLDAPARARAASHAREVAFHELEAAVLAALHDAEAAAFALEAAEARLDGARARRTATDALLAARRAQLETDPTALEALVFVAGRRVDAARQVREAALAAARARVEAAYASGWPTAARVEETR
ncbi:MAG: hypothetical protein O2894_05420 [Planctomycetota bacterium]|nr:hypothetical protein [Planctomycetota bacterium]